MKIFEKLTKREGQTVVEFMIVSLVVFFFLFFLLSISFVLVLSQYVDYATFMSARTYKAAHGDAGSQVSKAQEVFEAYIAPVRAMGLVRNVSSLEFTKINPGDRPNLSEGVRVNYDVNLFYLPPLFAKNKVNSAITLTSESFLGRDPNFDECVDFFKNFTNRLGINVQDLVGQMEDNGC
ncbi:MAG: TadE/TadG family type IV pilus assembly protein [Pseudomonadota bacterium]